MEFCHFHDIRKQHGKCPACEAICIQAAYIQELMKASPLWIKIANGHIFEGTLAQFQDCFFSNADTELIEDWASDHGYGVKFFRFGKMVDKFGEEI